MTTVSRYNQQVYVFIEGLYYIIAQSTRTGSPRGFSLNQTLHRLNNQQDFATITVNSFGA